MLRSYQTDLIEHLREMLRDHRRVLAVLPTGAGKTTIFCTIAARSIGRNNNVLILVHRAELIEQTSARLQEMGVAHGIIAPKYPAIHAQVQIASIQTIARRLDGFPWSPNLVIVDEAHHCTARTWRQVIEAYGTASVIGWTATPERLDGKGLAESFDVMIEGPGTRRLIDLGFLADYKLYAPPSEVDLSGLHKRAGDFQIEAVVDRVDRDNVIYAAVKNYKRYADGRSAIAFCASISHATHVCNQLTAAGIPADVVDGTLDSAERADRLARFKSGAIRVLVSVDLISEGFDVPGCECVLLMRPTASLALYLQQIGRALRPSDKPAIILDCVGNSALHGLPDQQRAWSLDGAKARQKDGVAAVPIRVCPACYAVHRPAPTCPFCGHAHASARKPPQEIEAELVEVDPVAAAAQKKAEQKKRRIEVGKARTLEELLKIAKERGYKPGWAHSVMKSRKS